MPMTSRPRTTTLGLLVAGAVIGIGLLALAGFCYFRFGLAPAGTAAPPLPLEKRVASWALKARIDREMPRTIPIDASAENLTTGAGTYKQGCAGCHGLPGRPSPFHTAMYPPPPQLLAGTGVTDDPPGMTYWKVTYGIRLTGMPAFDRSLTETERWQVSLMLAGAHDLPPVARETLGFGH